MTDDLISRQGAIDAFTCKGSIFTYGANECKTIVSRIMTLPSAQPDIIYCKDCKYQTESWSGIKYCEAHGDHIGKDYDYCSNARRKENG